MDYKQAVKDQKSELRDLHSRMDDDYDLVNLESYVLRDVDKRKISNTISITLNDAAVFAANVESALGEATEQISVETEDSKLDTAYIEDAIRACFAMANRRLRKQNKRRLNQFFDQSLCRRGSAAARCLFRMEDGQLKPDIDYWDTRHVYYGVGNESLEWAAYESPNRSKADILSEYPDANVKAKTATVLDIWTPDHNEVYINDKKFKEVPHNYGYVPVVIGKVPLGSMLIGDNYLKYEGESIFFLIRDLIPELNRLVSIIQSLNQRELDHVLQWVSQEGANAETPTYDDLTTPGTVIATEQGGGAQPVPFGHLRNQALWLHEMIETRIQRGSLSNFEYGTFSQPMSAVALITIGEGRDQVFLPRLGERGIINQDLSEMTIDQLIKTGERSIEIGTPGHRRSFDIAKLQGQYEVEFKYFVKSPRIDAARYTMAAGAHGLIPEKSIRRDILQREDPDEDERILRWEEAERISPLVKKRRVIADLLELAERGDEDARIDAELMAAEMGVSIEQLKSGQLPQPEQELEVEKQPREMLPMFAGERAGGGSSAQRAADLRKTPVEAE